MSRDIQRRTYQFALQIVSLHRDLSRSRGVGRLLRNQLLHAGTSIGANMEEADAAQSRADFINKCRIALKEGRETLYWLNLLRDSGEVAEDRIAPICREAHEIVAILTTIVKKSTTISR